MKKKYINVVLTGALACENSPHCFGAQASNYQPTLGEGASLHSSSQHSVLVKVMLPAVREKSPNLSGLGEGPASQSHSGTQAIRESALFNICPLAMGKERAWKIHLHFFFFLTIQPGGSTHDYFLFHW